MCVALNGHFFSWILLLSYHSYAPILLIIIGIIRFHGLVVLRSKTMLICTLCANLSCCCAERFGRCQCAFSELCVCIHPVESFHKYSFFLMWKWHACIPMVWLPWKLQSTINTRSLMLSLHLTPSASFLLQASSFSCTNLWMYTLNSLFIKKDFFYDALHLTPHFIYPTSPDRQPTWVQIKIFNSWKMSIEMNVLVVGLDSHCSRYIISMFRWKPREQHLLYLFIVLPGMIQTKKQQQQFAIQRIFS